MSHFWDGFEKTAIKRDTAVKAKKLMQDIATKAMKQKPQDTATYKKIQPRYVRIVERMMKRDYPSSIAGNKRKGWTDR